MKLALFAYPTQIHSDSDVDIRGAVVACVRSRCSCAGRAGSFVASFHTSFTLSVLSCFTLIALGDIESSNSHAYSHIHFTHTLLFFLSCFQSTFIFHFASISLDMGAPDQRALAWHLLLLFFQFAVISWCCCDIYHGLAPHGMLDVQVGVHFIFILLRC